MSDAYDMIDRFLRNNLGDDDYAEYSQALDSLCSIQPAQADSLLVKRDEWDALSPDARQLLNAAARAQPAQAVPLLSDEEAQACIPTVTLKGEKPVPMVWLKQADAITAIRSAEQAVRAKLGVVVPQWLPISTAPKDEAVWLGSAIRQQAFVGQWKDYMRHNSPQVTHWMQLPEPPNGTN